MTWTDQLLGRPTAVLSIAAALLLGGAWAATTVPLEWVPRVHVHRVNVTASWPGASSRAVERRITAPIEQVSQRLEGTRRVESTSREGRATVTIEVRPNADLALFTAELTDRLSHLEQDLPQNVAPRVTKQMPEELQEERGFMTLQLVGPQRPDVLRRIADEQLVPRLQALEGTARIDVSGGTRREIRVELDPDAMDTYQIRPSQVRSELRAALTRSDLGRLTTGSLARSVYVPGTRNLDALRTLPLAATDTTSTLRLSEVADLAVRPTPTQSISRIDGNAVVTLRIDRPSGSSILGVSNQVRERIRVLRESLPPETRLLIADDQSERVREQLRDLTWRGGLGLLLVLMVLFLLLRSLRAAGIVLFTVAVSIAVSLALLGPLGLTLNLITIAGLVLVFGLLIDNAAVITEQIQLQRARLLDRGRSNPAELESESTRKALSHVWLPLLGGTLSTMAVLVPLVYLSGELRALFLPFGVLVGLTLGFSLLAAALLVPVLGRFLPAPTGRWALPTSIRRVIETPYWVADRFPKFTLLVLFVTLGVPLWTLPLTLEEPDEGWNAVEQRAATIYNHTVGLEWTQEARDVLDPALGGVLRQFSRRAEFGARFQFEGRPELRVRIQLPSGGSVSQADTLIRPFEREALAASSVRRTFLTIRPPGDQGGPVARLRIQFEDGALSRTEPYRLRQDLIGRAIGQGGVTISVTGLLPQGYYSSIGQNISGERLQAYGPSYEELDLLIERFAERARRGSPRVAAVHTNVGGTGYRVEEPRQVFTVRWPPEATARSGLRGQEIASALRPQLATDTQIGEVVFPGRGLLPVRLVTKNTGSTDIRSLTNRLFRSETGRPFRLGTHAEQSIDPVPPVIQRADQQYRRTVVIDYRGPHRLADEYVDELVDGFATPPGYRIERSQYRFFSEERQELFGWLALAATGLVFLITAALFESWWLPLVVLLSVPLAMIGVGLGFIWTGASVAEGAFIGGVLMIGIAVNDSVLLTDRYRELQIRRASTAPGTLARLALRERLRPMWTTTLTSIATLVPLLIFPAEDAFWTGLAVTVIGGLLASTVLAPAAAVAMISLRRAEKPGCTD